MFAGTAPRSENPLGRVRQQRFGSLAIAVAAVTLLFGGLVALSPGASAAPPPDVLLGTAAPFSVLGASTVTNTGPTTLSGNYGVSPGTAITGFPPGIGGTRHAKDAVAAQAKSDLGTAYTDAAGRATTASKAGDLVGQTLVAGVYTSSGPLALSGQLTFDGQGDPSSVFIVQIASTLITASSSHVLAINGAQACHIYWQVGSSATLGTASTFQGTIMAHTSVTVTTSAHVKGRALAQTGAVTLDNDVFTNPDCSNTSQPTDATPTATTVSTTATTTTAGSTVTLTSLVSGGGAGVPTGTVTFSQNGVVLGTAPVSATGHARLTFPVGSTVSTRSITAHFNGSPNQAPSTSTAASLIVRAAPVIAPAATTPATTAPVTQTPTAPRTSAAVIVPAAVSTTPIASGSESTSSPAVAGNTTTALANTGTSHLGGIAGAGAGLIVLGFGLVTTTRRRRHIRRH
jgi:hypothetical protein